MWCHTVQWGGTNPTSLSCCSGKHLEATVILLTSYIIKQCNNKYVFFNSHSLIKSKPFQSWLFPGSYLLHLYSSLVPEGFPLPNLHFSSLFSPPTNSISFGHQLRNAKGYRRTVWGFFLSSYWQGLLLKSLKNKRRNKMRQNNDWNPYNAPVVSESWLFVSG